ncbi:MAG: hypothetical protein JWO06_2688 [Bacteroidota bacterium]|nr:hypothetical protein [Bacteroidota bacterium]
MALDCLNGVVGVRGCDAGNSLVYVNSLPGISVADFDKAINNESRNAYTRIAELIQLAISEVQQDVQGALLGKYELKTFIENDVIGHFQDDRVVTPQIPGNMVGVQVRVNLTPYLKLFIRQVKLYCKYTGPVNIKIYDLIQGTLLDTIPINALAGQIVTLPIDKEYFSDRQRINLFIGYESDFDAYKTLLTAYTDDTGTSSSYANSWMFFRGVSLADNVPALRENLVGNSGTGGLSISYSLQCSFDEHLCNIKKMLAMPILYKTGSLIMKEMKHSKRLNGVVISYTQNHDELMKDYNNEYLLRMNQLFQNLVMPDSLCFSCAGLTESRTILP